MTYTDEQKASLKRARQTLMAGGRPEVVATLNIMVAEEADYDEIWKLANASTDNMAKPSLDAVEHPPFAGRGSTVQAWRDYAMKVTDMDSEVVGSMQRNDLIQILVDDKIIEEPEFELGGNESLRKNQT